jgi:hypothetical protein
MIARALPRVAGAYIAGFGATDKGGAMGLAGAGNRHYSERRYHSPLIDQE